MCLCYTKYVHVNQTKGTILSNFGKISSAETRYDTIEDIYEDQKTDE